MKLQQRRIRLVPPACILAVAGSLVGCEALGSAALDAGRKFLLGTASQNYGAEYTGSLEKMVDLLMKPISGAVAVQPPPAQSTPPAAATPEPAPAPSAAADPIVLDIVLLREVVADGRTAALPIQDGEVLRDGFGRNEPGDNFKLSVRANTTCWLYVIDIDATGWAQPIFPNAEYSALQNPVEPGRALVWPEGKDWIYLDQYRGVETLYFVASRGPRPELEQVLGDLARMKRPASDPPARVEQVAAITRGLAGKRPGTEAMVLSSTGLPCGVPSQAFVSQLAGAELVVTRWFRHE